MLENSYYSNDFLIITQILFLDHCWEDFQYQNCSYRILVIIEILCRYIIKIEFLIKKLRKYLLDWSQEDYSSQILFLILKTLFLMDFIFQWIRSDLTES